MNKEAGIKKIKQFVQVALLISGGADLNPGIQALELCMYDI